jgi:cytochrome b pre-mRNA-processing protein 3
MAGMQDLRALVTHEGLLVEPTMLWPFNHFRKPRLAPRGTIDAIYGMIVTQAREPLFYRDLGVPDTVNGRFDLIVLHLWTVLRRLREIAGTAAPAQALFDRFCADMDDNLREMAIGDLAVPKKMQAFGEAFYGRIAAYDMALTDSPEGLAQAIGRNILGGGDIENARRLATYANAVIATLGKLDATSLANASWAFPLPQMETASP